MQKKHSLYCMFTCILLIGLVYMFRDSNHWDHGGVEHDPFINKREELYSREFGNTEPDHEYTPEDHSQSLVPDVQFIFEPEPYETNTSCSVRVFTDKTELNKVIKSSSYSAQPCSMKYLKQYLYDNKKLFGTGVWSVPKDGSLSMDVEFYPEGCYFQHELNSVERIQKCFEQKHLTKFLITGDSHSVIMRRVMDEFIMELNGGTPCYRFRKSRGEMAEYFKIPDIEKDTIQAHEDACQEARCQLVNNSSFLLEKISMVHLLDGSLRVEDSTSMKGRFLSRAYYTVTKLEYLLKHYLPYNGFPDVWLFMLPFQHDCWNNSVEKIRLDILYMMELFKMYLPDTTTLIFLPTTRECQDLQPPEIAPEYEGYYKRKRNPTIHAMNQQLVRVLLESEQKDNIHVFLDVNKISCPFMCKWHHDGAHMLPDWYAKMIRYILETYCVDTQW